MLYLSSGPRRIALLLTASTALLPSSAGEGGLAVHVVDAAGRPFSGAQVVISSATQIGGARQLSSDAGGRARFVRLNPGDFQVVVSAPGLQSVTLSQVPVKVDQTTAAQVVLREVAGATVAVTDAVRLVDATTVTAGTQFTQENLDGLPVGRDQLSTIALAPGVLALPSNVTGSTANPGLLFGLNRTSGGSASGGANGARNNTYLIDGVDVTNPETGTGRTQLPPELIQVQDIKTGGITAEYSARAGLFSHVTTKSGSNAFAGGLSFQERLPSFQSSPAPGRLDVAKRTTTEVNAWALGPILQDKLWYVVDAQKVKDTVEVHPPAGNAVTPGERRTGTLADGSRFFGKLTWQISPLDQASFSYNHDPLTADNLVDPNTRTNRGNRLEQGGSRYLATYAHQFDTLFLDLRASRHEERNSTVALYSGDGPFNNILSATPISGSQKFLGDSSAEDIRKDVRTEVRADVTWLFTALGAHTLKGGVQVGTESLTRTTGIAQGAAYESYLSPVAWGSTAAVGGNINGFKNKVVAAINANPGLVGALAGAGFHPTGPGGTFVSTDLNGYQFNTANPLGGYYSYRNILESKNASTPKMEKQGFYLQDQWQLGTFTLNPGIRFDGYTYVADDGSRLFKTGLNAAPRVGLAWDVRGDGRSKAYAYYGRYVDPIKLDMVRFTGSLTSSVNLEQAYIQNQWLTFNTRGGKKTLDAVFADTFKLPKTDELRLGYTQEFATDYSFEVAGTWRRDFDIVEDWDITLFTDRALLEAEARSVFGIGATPTPATAQQHAIDLYRSLYIDPSYFSGGGFTGAQNVQRAKTGALNYMLGNLPGGERKYRSLELTLNRKDADHWSGFATLSFVHADGNSYSSGDAGRQADNAQWDPRLPYMNGRLAGSISWAFKAYGAYHWDNGLRIGANFLAYSGFAYARGLVGGGLDAAPALDQIDNPRQIHWTPRFYQLDVRVSYGRNLTPKVRGEVFIDVFNFLNRQGATGLAESNNLWGAAPVADTPYQYQAPRNGVLGARITF